MSHTRDESVLKIGTVGKVKVKVKVVTSQEIDDVTVTKYKLIFSWTLRAEAWMAKVQIMH